MPTGNFMYYRKLICLLILISISACKKEESGAQNQNVNLAPGQTCAPGKWIGLTQGLTLNVSSDFSADEKNTISQSMNEWNLRAPAGVSLFKNTLNATATNSYATLSSYRDNEFGIYKKSPWFNDVSSNALAITQYFGYLKSNNGKAYLELSHADIIFNTEDHNFINSTGPSSNYDFQTVLTHEIGHFLGFCHESSQTSIMYPYYVTANRLLKTWDIQELQNRYGNPNIAPILSKTSLAVKETNLDEGTLVRGVIELHATGDCIHKLNGKEIYRHKR